MDPYLYAYFAGIATVIGAIIFIIVAKILLERGTVSYQCTICGEKVVSATRFDRLTELKYATHRAFKRCDRRRVSWVE